MTKRQILTHVTNVACLLFLTSGTVVFAQENIGTDSIGKMEFQKNCASCHGMGGKGDGPLVEFLRQTPPDLTLLRKKHGGVYPHVKVYDWIRDAQSIRAHGTQEMPIWGDRYSQEIIERYGPDYAGPGSSVGERILELVFYLGTIQQ
ncbi:MAG: cytochrome c [Sedimenticola sp.]